MTIPDEAVQAAHEAMRSRGIRDERSTKERAIDALTAALPFLQGLKVKALEWGSTSYGTPEVFTDVGVYRIVSAWNGGWSLTRNNSSILDSDGRSNFLTQEAAKAAAQADYAARILSAVEAADTIETYYARQIEWSKKTFGPALRTLGILDHIRKELKEIEAEPHDLSEWIDVVILAMDGFWRHGGSVNDLMPRLIAKQTKNMARDWPDWRTMSEDSAIEHDRSKDASPSPRAQALEEAARLIETKQEGFQVRGGGRVLIDRSEGDQSGLGYAAAIRALGTSREPLIQEHSTLEAQSTNEPGAHSERERALEEAALLNEAKELAFTAISRMRAAHISCLDLTLQAENLVGNIEAAERALSSQPVTDGWLPMTHPDLPLNGASVEVFDSFVSGKDGFGQVIARFDKTHGWHVSASVVGGIYIKLTNPTHWRPLPQSPGASNE